MFYFLGPHSSPITQIAGVQFLLSVCLYAFRIIRCVTVKVCYWC